MNIFLSPLNYLGSGTIDLWFTISVGAGADAILVIGAGIPTHVLDMFCLVVLLMVCCLTCQVLLYCLFCWPLILCLVCRVLQTLPGTLIVLH